VTPSDVTDSAAFSFDAITKVFPPATVALHDVSLSVESGVIHAFIGENGAGKSTLMKVLAGEVVPDSGAVRVHGRAVRFRSPAEAMADGIGMVHQEILLVNELRVWENVVLGIEPVMGGFRGLRRIDRNRARSDVNASIDAYGLGLDVDALVGDLTVGARQKVEICKLLHRGMQIIILDEPTAVLAPQEIPQLFDELRRLRDSGRTICFISHHLDEVLELSDTITVLRGGRHVRTLPAASAKAAELAHLMVARDLGVPTRRPAAEIGRPVLELRNVRWSEPGSAFELGPIDLQVRAGEIVGIAGVDGNGQAQLVDCIVGARRPISGTVGIEATDCTSKSILQRRTLLAYVPAERKTAGSALDASLAENTAMTHHRLSDRFSHRMGPLRLLDRRVVRSTAETIRREYSVAAPSIDVAVKTLSGGNQQKLVLGRELLEVRPLIILDQPTRGLDVGSMEFVHDRIRQLRAEGRAIVLVSADLEEIQELSDRVVVLHRGRIALDAENADLSPDTIGRAMLEGQERGRPTRQGPGVAGAS
jgi:general nucleoside transport system ATP-binding protein